MTAEERKVLIGRMCMTYRHDFGLTRDPCDLMGSGMTETERDGLRLTMGQILTHDIEPAIRAAETEARNRALEEAHAAVTVQSLHLPDHGEWHKGYTCAISESARAIHYLKSTTP